MNAPSRAFAAGTERPPQVQSPEGTRPSDLGLRLIVAYKAIKAASEALLGAWLLGFGSASTQTLHSIAVKLSHHATAAWSIELAHELVHAATARHLVVVGLASVLDGAFSAVEGWALYRRYRWSIWLVIGATASLLPFETAALVHHFSAGRSALLLVNAVIVAYLLLHAGSVTEHDGS